MSRDGKPSIAAVCVLESIYLPFSEISNLSFLIAIGLVGFFAKKIFPAKRYQAGLSGIIRYQAVR
jgi:hypothetical protein